MARLNNEVGHVLGDQVLRIVYDIMSEAASARSGVVYRDRANSIAHVPCVSREDAAELAEHVRTQIPTAAVGLVQREAPVTARLSVVVWSHENTIDGMHLVGVPDKALWEAPVPHNATVVIGQNGERTFVPPAWTSDGTSSALNEAYLFGSQVDWQVFERFFPWRPGEHHVRWVRMTSEFWNEGECHTCGARNFGTFAAGEFRWYEFRDGVSVNNLHCPNCECGDCPLPLAHQAPHPVR